MGDSRIIIKGKKPASQTEEEILIHAAREASSKAVRSSFALGLNVQFIEDGKIVEVGPTGKRIVRERKTTTRKVDLSNLKKGMVLEKK